LIPETGIRASLNQIKIFMTLSEIKKQKETSIDELFKSCGVFFAFSNEQFHKNKTPLQEGEKYVSIGGGGYCPKSKREALLNGFESINKTFKEAIKSNKQRQAHILYELQNHEAFYTGSIEETMDALGTDYTEDEVKTVFRKNREKELERI
jgi:shikimate kinase